MPAPLGRSAPQNTRRPSDPRARHPLPPTPPPQIANVTGTCPKTFTPLTGDELLPPTPDCDLKINLTTSEDYFLTSQVTDWPSTRRFDAAGGGGGWEQAGPIRQNLGGMDGKARRAAGRERGGA
jgi:hypothetical protein